MLLGVTFLEAAGAVVGRFGSTVDTDFTGGIVGFELARDVALVFESGGGFDTVAGFTTFGSTLDGLLSLSVDSFRSASSALPFSSSKESVGRLAYPLGWLNLVAQ